MSDLLPDDAPSPWWPCPECGNHEMQTSVLFERGRWVSDDDEATYVEYDPPYGYPSAVNVSDVVCAGCGHRFAIAGHYGWQDRTPGDEA